MEAFVAGFLMVWPWATWALGILAAVCTALFLLGLLAFAVLVVLGPLTGILD